MGSCAVALALIVCAPVTAAARAPATAGAPATAPSGAPSTERIAAALYSLARFVDWPADAFDGPDSPFVMAVLGDEAASRALARVVAHKRLHGRPIEVRPCRNLDEFESAHLLYIGRSKARLLETILDFLRFLGARPVLTVGDREDFVVRGGMVRLVETRADIGLEIGLAAARRAHLTISSELLELASLREGLPAAEAQ